MKLSESFMCVVVWRVSHVLLQTQINFINAMPDRYLLIPNSAVVAVCNGGEREC